MNNPRKSPRAQWINYESGIYFITICTKNRMHYFGFVRDGEMILSEIGKIVDYELAHVAEHHPEIEIPLYVVMPNHIHAIVRCNPDMAGHIPNEQRNPNPAFRANPDMARHVPTLTKYIASFKSAVSKMSRILMPDFGWQPRYYDHLIRGTRDGNNIVNYIINNPQNWNKDCFNS